MSSPAEAFAGCRGGMVFTFMQARGQATGSSMVESGKVELARCGFCQHVQARVWDAVAVCDECLISGSEILMSRGTSSTAAGAARQLHGGGPAR